MSQQLGKKFDEILFECIYSAFIDIFGQVITVFIFNKIGIESAKIEIKNFSESLESRLNTTAHILEKRILEDLYSQIGIQFQEKEKYTFIDYINEVKVIMASRELRKSKELEETFGNQIKQSIGRQVYY